MQISEEKINANWLLYMKKLEQYRCYSESLVGELGNALKYAPYSKTVADGGCYDGGLIDVTLFSLCKVAANVNNVLAATEPTLAVNNDMLMKVLLLLNISKCEMFEKEEDSYLIKRGNLYRFKETHPTYLNVAERSVLLCQKHGVTLEEEEFSAILMTDGQEKNEKRIADSPLCRIVRCARMLTETKITLEEKAQH